MKMPVLAWWLLAAVAADPVRVERSTVYYDIAGRTAADLRAAMDARGPVGPNGRRGDAYTVWRVNWRYRYSAADGACRLTQLDVSLAVTFTFPRWLDETKAQEGLQRRWGTYMKALTAHEDGHAEIGQRAAGRVADLRRQVGVHTTCQALEDAIKRVAETVLDEERRNELRYDKDTDFGRTQGARFP